MSVLTKTFPDNRSTQDTVTILNGQTASSGFDSYGMTFVSLRYPIAFDGTALSFQSSRTVNGTFQDIFNQDGVQFVIPVRLNASVTWDPIDFLAHRFVKLVSNTTETADRIFDLTFAPK